MTVSKKPIKSNLQQLDAMTDDEINYDDIPEFDAAFLESVEMKFSPGKKANRLASGHRHSGVDASPRQRVPKPN